MAAILEIRELPNGLSFRVTEPRHLGRILLLTACGVAFLIMLARGTDFAPTRIVFGCLVAFTLVRSIISSMRGTKAELVITNLDFRTEGHSPRDGYKSAIVSRADIEYMSFRKATGGGDDAEYPSGLYVEYRGALFGSAICLLPDIDEAQTNQVMEAIYCKFPDTGTLAPPASSESYLTLLNLNRHD